VIAQTSSAAVENSRFACWPATAGAGRQRSFGCSRRKALRREILRAYDENGIELPYRQGRVYAMAEE
jgi:small-conductance mechanosensitive channel